MAQNYNSWAEYASFWAKSTQKIIDFAQKVEFLAKSTQKQVDFAREIHLFLKTDHLFAGKQIKKQIKSLLNRKTKVFDVLKEFCRDSFHRKFAAQMKIFRCKTGFFKIWPSILYRVPRKHERQDGEGRKMTENGAFAFLCSFEFLYHLHPKKEEGLSSL